MVAGLGLPLAGWWYTRRPRGAAASRGHDEIGRWLLSRCELSWAQRARVQRAVLAGRQPDDPALRGPARALAAEILADRFRTLRIARRVGWAQLAAGCLYGRQRRNAQLILHGSRDAAP